MKREWIIRLGRTKSITFCLNFLNPYSITLFIKLRFQKKLLFVRDTSKKEDFKWTPVRKTLRPSSVPSLFNWSKESTQRRQIIKTPLPQKRRKTDDDATDNDEELGSSNWLLHENR